MTKKNVFFACLFAGIAAILMGGLGFFVRSSQSSAVTCTFSRFAIGCLLIALCYGCQIIRKKEQWQFSKNSFLSGLSISLCIFFYFLAIQKTAVGIAAFLLYLGPILAIVGECFVQRKKPSLLQVGLITISLAGLILISVSSKTESLEQDSLHTVMQNLGVVYGVLSAICYAGYILLSRLIPSEVSVLQRSFWQFIGGTGVTTLMWLSAACPMENLEQGWPYLLAIGVIQGFWVILLIAYAVKHLSAIQFGTISYLEPVVAVLLGFFLYKEKISCWQGMGLGLIIIATVLQSFFTIKTKMEHELNEQQ